MRIQAKLLKINFILTSLAIYFIEDNYLSILGCILAGIFMGPVVGILSFLLLWLRFAIIFHFTWITYVHPIVILVNESQENHDFEVVVMSGRNVSSFSITRDDVNSIVLEKLTFSLNVKVYKIETVNGNIFYIVKSIFNSECVIRLLKCLQSKS